MAERKSLLALINLQLGHCLLNILVFLVVTWSRGHSWPLIHQFVHLIVVPLEVVDLLGPLARVVESPHHELLGGGHLPVAVVEHLEDLWTILVLGLQGSQLLLEVAVVFEHVRVVDASRDTE